ncbi:MAG: TetR/AcrR family transcriptional regulator [Candidatus Binataceae bacterium]
MSIRSGRGVDHQGRRREIARAAIRMIDARGLDGVRLRDVARDTQATTGTVTHYFSSKEEVLVAALKEIVEGIIEDETAALGSQAINCVEDLVRASRRRVSVCS